MINLIMKGILCSETCLSMEPCGNNSKCVEGNGIDDPVCICLPGYHQDTDGSCHGEFVYIYFSYIQI